MNLKSGYPFSLIKNGLVANYPKLEKNIGMDVVIIRGQDPCLAPGMKIFTPLQKGCFN